MNAAEWDTCSDPERMLTAAAKKLSDRKLLLLGCGCARLLWDHLPDWARIVVPQLERVADETDPDLRTVAIREAVAATAGVGTFIELAFMLLQPQVTIQHLIHPVLQVLRNLEHQTTLPPDAPGGAFFGLFHVADGPITSPGQVAILRCVMGNPFRKVRFRPSWRTSDAVLLAKGIHADRAFDRLPILSDALQDAGCAEPRILDHLRSNVPHARGCWVVDRILDKS